MVVAFSVALGAACAQGWNLHMTLFLGVFCLMGVAEGSRTLSLYSVIFTQFWQPRRGNVWGRHPTGHAAWQPVVARSEKARRQAVHQARKDAARRWARPRSRNSASLSHECRSGSSLCGCRVR